MRQNMLGILGMYAALGSMSNNHLFEDPLTLTQRGSVGKSGKSLDRQRFKTSSGRPKRDIEAFAAALMEHNDSFPNAKTFYPQDFKTQGNSLKAATKFLRKLLATHGISVEATLAQLIEEIEKKQSDKETD